MMAGADLVIRPTGSFFYFVRHNVVEPFRLIGCELEEKASKKKHFSNLAHCSHTGMP
jgi:hypothetical protein